MNETTTSPTEAAEPFSGRDHADTGTTIGIERDLGVDDQVLALGQVHHGVWALATLLSVDADFALVVLAQLQARAVEHVLQHQLAPVALQLLLPAQRGRQLVGLGGDLLVECLE